MYHCVALSVMKWKVHSSARFFFFFQVAGNVFFSETMNLNSDKIQQWLCLITSAVLPWLHTAETVTTTTASLFHQLCTTQNK